MRRLAFLLIVLTLLPLIAVAETPAAGEHPAAAAGDHAAPAAGEHHEEVYFGFVPGWVLKTLNMLLFFGVLAYFIGGPVKKAFAERSAAIRAASDEARERRDKADRMAGDIQARLSAIEAEVQAIQERAHTEGERQKRELLVAAEAESEKILKNAASEVDNRLKYARKELTEYAGELAAQRAEQILREKITEQDQKNLFQESLREVREVER